MPGHLWESAQVRFNPTGNVQVFTGTHSHGQGHETTFAQLVCDQLGVPIENIEVIHGDTAKTQFGMGTYGSRSLAAGAAIARACDKLIAKGKKGARTPWRQPKVISSLPMEISAWPAPTRR